MTSERLPVGGDRSLVRRDDELARIQGGGDQRVGKRSAWRAYNNDVHLRIKYRGRVRREVLDIHIALDLAHHYVTKVERLPIAPNRLIDTAPSPPTGNERGPRRC